MNSPIGIVFERLQAEAEKRGGSVRVRWNGRCWDLKLLDRDPKPVRATMTLWHPNTWWGSGYGLAWIEGDEVPYRLYASSFLAGEIDLLDQKMEGLPLENGRIKCRVPARRSSRRQKEETRPFDKTKRRSQERASFYNAGLVTSGGTSITTSWHRSNLSSISRLIYKLKNIKTASRIIRSIIFLFLIVITAGISI